MRYWSVTVRSGASVCVCIINHVSCLPRSVTLTRAIYRHRVGQQDQQKTPNFGKHNWPINNSSSTVINRDRFSSAEGLKGARTSHIAALIVGIPPLSTRWLRQGWEKSSVS
ncbi:hypothetical protein RRG08_045149 [Elysia crispata]|uniref:Uncharacterized protein n=1 Tax=Elysia crispata TaxID=231223 RepID=A0AAE1A3F9_9GAST|nr:hypothetical protein RRG08_045149 [Elysia crispata]